MAGELIRSGPTSGQARDRLFSLSMRASAPKPRKDGDIIITLPWTDYTVTYFKPERSPQLLAKDISARDDPRLPMTGAEFLAQAWRLANDKARELGWIV